MNYGKNNSKIKIEKKKKIWFFSFMNDTLSTSDEESVPSN